MKSGKTPQFSKKSEASIVRSSAAEYLTFVAAKRWGWIEEMLK